MCMVQLVIVVKLVHSVHLIATYDTYSIARWNICGTVTTSTYGTAGTKALLHLLQAYLWIPWLYLLLIHETNHSTLSL